VDLAAFSAELPRDASGLGGAVDRKPHLQRLSADFGGQRQVGFGRIVVSEIEVPITLANLV
jgi:hypothetical protein